MAVVKTNILGLAYSKVPILKVLLPYIFGICISNFSVIQLFSFWLELSVCCFVFWLLGFVRRRKYYGNILTIIGFNTFWLTLGICIANIALPSFKKFHFSHYSAENLLVIIDDEPVVKDKIIRFTAEVKAVYLDSSLVGTVGKMLITISKDSTQTMDFRYGDLLVVNSNIRYVDPPFNPYQFNFKDYLINRNIWHQCFLTTDQFKKIDTNKGNHFLAWTLRFRESMVAKFSLYIKDRNSLLLATALIFGYRSEMDEHTVNVFTNTGTVHILSVSGLHVAMLFGLLTFLLGWLDRFTFGKQLRALIVFFIIWFYVVLTGMNPPIVRAGIMISFFILSLLINRQQVSMNTLFASALFILILSPKSLFDIGFQLSYLAVMGILMLFPLLKSLYLPRWKWRRIIMEYCYISIAAQLFTLPIVLYYFGQFPTYFIPANLFIALPSAFIMYLGVGLAFSPIDFINIYIGIGLSALLKLAVEGLNVIEKLPKAVIEGMFWNNFQVYLMFVVILFCILAWNFKEKKVAFLAFFVLILHSFLTNFCYFKKVGYEGYRIYNVRSDIAIAAISKGRATVFSNFESLQHKASRFSILSDLKHWVTHDKISYNKLEHKMGQNYVVCLADIKILVLETALLDTVSHVDIVLWRKNNRNTVEKIKEKVAGNFAIVVDGSNSDKTIKQIQRYKDVLEKEIYILKDNFAYVWNKE